MATTEVKASAEQLRRVLETMRARRNALLRELERYRMLRTLTDTATNAADAKRAFDASEKVWANIVEHRRAQGRADAARIGDWAKRQIVASDGSIFDDQK